MLLDQMVLNLDTSDLLDEVLVILKADTSPDASVESCKSLILN